MTAKSLDHTTVLVEAWPVRLARRTLDLLGAGLGLLLLAPVMLMIAAAVRAESRGGVLFRQQRVGRGQRPFLLYKFRTMRPGGDDRALRALIAAELRAEDTSKSGSCKIHDDPRITRVGRVLRRASLDELPQLFNVLRGDMSLVGPRPCLQWEAAMFPRMFDARFTVRPGLTGLWQVSGRSTVGTLEMLQLDMDYIQTRRLSEDVRIMLWTVPSMLSGDGAR